MTDQLTVRIIELINSFGYLSYEDATEIIEATSNKARKMILNGYAYTCHEASKTWWTDLKTGQYPIERNVGEMLMLMVSELAEAMEGHRKDLQDDKLPQYKMFDVELVDCLIRIFDLAGKLNINLDEIFAAKMQYNKRREDHKPENRLKENGKKY